MLKIEKFVTMSPEQYEIVIEGMRNPKNSWDKIDSGICKGGDNGIGCENCAAAPCGHEFDHSYQFGVNDYGLMENLADGGPVHAKYRRMLIVYLTIRAPFYWWKEFDTYKVGTVCNSCSTMHKIHAKPFELSDFSWERLTEDGLADLERTIDLLESNRQTFLTATDEEVRKLAWNEMIKLLPSCYEQKRTIMLNYEVLVGIYKWRRNHKLGEWHTFCDWIEALPYSDLITGSRD